MNIPILTVKDDQGNIIDIPAIRGPQGEPGSELPLSSIIEAIYPVGSIYMSVNSTSPATLFGGNWEQIQGRFLLGASSTYSAGTTGGEATHTLTVNEMPVHSHPYDGDGTNFTSSGTTYFAKSGTAYPNSPGVNMGAAYSSQGTVSQRAVGGGEAHNNMPPFLSVYIWKRTA